MKKYLVILCLLLLIGCDPLSFFDDSENDADEETDTTEDELETEEEETTESLVEILEDYYPLRTVINSHLPNKILLRDESRGDASLEQFVLRLKHIVYHQDVEKLIDLLSEDVNYSFGDDNTSPTEGFKRYWELENNSQTSPIWSQLARILPYGGSYIREEGLYVIPYMYHSLSDEYGEVILGENVNVREAPGISSDIVTQLSYEIITVVNKETNEKEEIDGIEYKWVEIETFDGLTGYVVDRFIYNNMFDYRLGIRKEEEEWKIVFFLEGD